MEKLVVRHAHQPRRRRRLRPRRVREDALARSAACSQASKNAANGISFIQTAEGYLQETPGHPPAASASSSVQASNGIYTAEDRMQIQVEVSQLVDEIDRIASHAQFNGMNLLTGRFARETGENVVTGSMWFHIGANMDQRERVYIGTMTAKGLGVQQRGQRARSSSSPTPTAPTAPSGSWTRPSRWSTSSAPTSAPTRTGSSTRSRASTSAPRTCRPPRAGSATPTWRSEMVEYTKNADPGAVGDARCWPRPTSKTPDGLAAAPVA
ncbi:MAG: hypothetical protein MZV65_16325 [Chromatiales bacterium]|nr:hypothetical protein [Chromatiales bacterium]